MNGIKTDGTMANDTNLNMQSLTERTTMKKEGERSTMGHSSAARDSAREFTYNIFWSGL